MQCKVRLDEHLLFKFVLIDLFLLPYFNVIVIPFSYFAIIWWRLNHRHCVKSNREYGSIVICILLMIVSTCIGGVINSSYGVNGDNIKRLVQYILTFEYFFFFQTYLKNNRPKIKNILMIFVLLVVALAVIFQISPSMFVDITSVWNKGNAYNSNQLLESVEFGYTVRYNFFWTDPNNIAYALTGIILFMLMYCETTLAERIVLLFANIFVLFSCMSSGGWISFAISWGIYLVYAVATGRLFDKRLTYRGLFGCLLVAFAIFLFVKSGALANFANSDLVENALERLNNNENTRTEIWKRILDGQNIFTNLFFGQGSTIYISGIQRATHSGHLYWIYAYGIVSYCIFMKEFFWLGLSRISRYIPVISFFLCFTMNTMIGEQKLFLIFVLIVCYLKAEVGGYGDKATKG